MLNPRTVEFVSKIIVKFDADSLERTYTYRIESGQKFDKIVGSSGYSGGSGYVHAFVEQATGKLMKAGSWKAPQRDKDGLAYRYDLSTPEGMDEAVRNADPFGGYLYASYIKD